MLGTLVVEDAHRRDQALAPETNGSPSIIIRTLFVDFLLSRYQHLNSCRPHYQVDTTFRLHNVADLTNFKRVRRLFERLLHLSASEQSKVSTVGMRRAVRVLRRELREHICRPVDLGLIFTKDLDGFFFRASDFRLLDGWNESRFSIDDATRR